ncbi:hypothetical protein CSHISOI_08782 [Colletotrichum shisoi]|uniref:Uncharacterized protein n=1 Tax=Colletotrichum shisoi TaxID=2078593 RepID=A0A5Q4BHT2_9PEZI|nr:hypothetical protein CSHISOI_08782 [Colletotrichum shisoi]
MRSQSIISVAIVALSLLGEASAWCNFNKRTFEDCCYRTQDAKENQGDFMSTPIGSICPEKHLETCKADCCTWTTGLGTGCPK